VASQALGIVGSFLADNIHVGIMAGYTADTGICTVEALTVGEPVGLESHGQLATPVISNYCLPAAMTLAAKIRNIF